MILGETVLVGRGDGADFSPFGREARVVVRIGDAPEERVSDGLRVGREPAVLQGSSDVRGR